MSQSTYTIASGQSGTSYRTQDNDGKQALASFHKGSSAPAYAIAGLHWVDDSANPLWVLKMYDGTDWITTGTYNVTTNLFSPANAQLINGSSIYAADAGSNDTYAITNTSIPTLQAGQVIQFKANTANTGACTLNVNGAGAVTLKKDGTQDLNDNDILSGMIVTVIYDGTNFQVLSRLNGQTETYSLTAKTTMVSADGFRIFDSAASNIEKKITFANLQTALGSGYPKGYIAGPAPTYASAATITLPIGLKARNSADTADIEVTGSNITLSLATSGAAGLDTGSEASNTWYYVYLIRKSSDGTVSAVFSVTNEAVSGSITYPSGYDQKRQLPIAVRNNGSSNILSFYIQNWGINPTIMYNTDFPGSSTDTNTQTNVLDNGSAGSFTSVSCASYIPPISTIGIFHSAQTTAGTITYLRAAGSSLTNGLAVRNYDEDTHAHLVVPTNTSQAIEYKTTSTRLDLSVRGYTVNVGNF